MDEIKFRVCARGNEANDQSLIKNYFIPALKELGIELTIEDASIRSMMSYGDVKVGDVLAADFYVKMRKI